jgi:endoglucanase
MQCKPLRHLFFGLLMTAALLSCQSAAKVPGKKNEAQVFVEKLGLGYNLGNTLEACGGTKGYKISNFEIAWGAPLTTKEIFEDLKARGFDTIRIPVAWSNLMGENYAINPDLMNRVEEVVNMVLDSGMYAIVNIHWDGGWITKFPIEYEQSLAKYTRIWEQISERFASYGNKGNKKAAFELLNHINRTFVDLVRGSGGNNATRYLLIAGYATDIDLTCDKYFLMPVDEAGRSIVSVHYYSPPTFAILEKDADWGKAARTWGTPAELRRVKTDLNKVKARFIDKGIPAILGEYGTVINNKDPESVRRYLTEVASVAWKLGMCPILWGGSGDHYDRRALKFTDPLLGEMYAKLSKTRR